jgi:hypothetical protein
MICNIELNLIMINDKRYIIYRIFLLLTYFKNIVLIIEFVNTYTGINLTIMYDIIM